MRPVLYRQEVAVQFANSPADSQIVQNAHFFKIYDEKALEYILVSNGTSEDTYMLGRVAVSEIQNLIVAYKERFDKNNFIQNLLLDNMLLIDVYNRAKNRASIRKCAGLFTSLRRNTKRQYGDGDRQGTFQRPDEGFYHCSR